jgi:pyridoxal phosphate enzyme (YggS family)
MTSVSHCGSTISERIYQIRQTLPDSVRLIAVTKQVSIAAMREAYTAGVRDFGESRVQEAETKQAALQDLTDITWHLIGHLQGNKAQKALELFQWIHSVDSLKLAQRLNVLAETQGSKPKILLQVKILPDPNKYGWSETDLFNALPALNQLQSLDLQGLMTIPPLGAKPDEQMFVFQQAKSLADKIRQQSSQQPGNTLTMQQLSMGMSDDYLLAVAAGATMVRPGRLLFGDRP